MMKYKGSELAPLGTFDKKVPADIVAKVKAGQRKPTSCPASSPWRWTTAAEVDGEEIGLQLQPGKTSRDPGRALHIGQFGSQLTAPRQFSASRASASASATWWPTTPSR